MAIAIATAVAIALAATIAAVAIATTVTTARCCCRHYHRRRRRREQHNTKCKAIERMSVGDCMEMASGTMADVFLCANYSGGLGFVVQQEVWYAAVNSKSRMGHPWPRRRHRCNGEGGAEAPPNHRYAGKQFELAILQEMRFVWPGKWSRRSIVKLVKYNVLNIIELRKSQLKVSCFGCLGYCHIFMKA